MTPQLAKRFDSHVVPEQHPFGQDSGVHWQLPF
jgi:hypothetical protein